MQVLSKGVLIDEGFFVPPTDGSVPLVAAKDDNRNKVRGEARGGMYRVLVVEDDPSLLSLYGALLCEANLLVDQSPNGHDALEKLSITPYDLVITDLNLPGLNGISLLQWIQRHRPETTAIVISGDGSADRILAAMRGGAKDYLVKPFSLPEFQAIIERWCKPRRSFNCEVFSSLMKQVMHDVRGEMVNLEIMIKRLQRGKFGGMDAGVNSALLSMQEKLGQLKGLTEDYCLVVRNLLREGGDIPTERIGLQGEIITQVLGEMQEAMHRKKIRVVCSQNLAAEGDAYVMGNRLMMKSVFRTLFSNAIRHCHAAGVISYGISSNGRRYKVEVANEGDIVPADMQARIFDEFVQIRSGDSSSSQAAGLGMGLALAKDILRQHGGDIWYESFANGSKFVCTLPCQPAGKGSRAKSRKQRSAPKL